MEEVSVVYARFYAPTASFRYPLVTIGRQVSYALPPLSTLYGLLCAAYGEPYPPERLQLGFLFRSTPQLSEDIEKLWFLQRKEPGAKSKGAIELKNNVHVREWHTDVHLELFLWVKAPEDRPKWLEALRRPAFFLGLGRSQELLSLVEVRERSFPLYRGEKTSPLWAGHSLYPAAWQGRLGGHYHVETMPAYVPIPKRMPVLLRPFLYARSALSVKDSLPESDWDYTLLVPALPPYEGAWVVYLWPMDPARLAQQEAV